MAVLGAASYKLTADNTGLNKGLARAEQTARDRSKRIAGNFAKIGAAGVAMGGAILFGLSKTVTAASSLQESGTAVQAIFGEAEQTIFDFAKTSYDSVALSRQQFQQMAAESGALFTAMGMSQEEAADSVLILTKRAADLASIMDKDVNVALQSFKSALAGETESLRNQFGVDLTDTAVKAWALEKGLNANISTMTQAEKVNLRMAKALENTAFAEGDMAKNAKSTAIQLQKMRAQVKDATAMIGSGLLPVVEAVLPWIRASVEWFTEWAGRNPALMRALVITTAAIGILAVAIGGLLLAIAAGIALSPAAAAAWVAITGPIGLIAIAIAGVIAGIVLLIFYWDEIKAVWDKTPGWVKILVAVLSWPVTSIIAIVMSIIWLLENWRTVWNGIKAVWGAVRGAWDASWGWVAGNAVAIWDGLQAAWNATWGGIKAALSFVWEGIKAAWSIIWAPFKAAALAIWGGLQEAWDAVWARVMAALWARWNAIKVLWDVVWNPLKAAALAIWGGLQEAWDAVWARATIAVSGAWNVIKVLWDALWNPLRVAALAIWNGLETAWDTVWGGVKAALDLVWGGIKTAWDTAWGWVASVAGNVWDGLKITWDIAWVGLKNLVKNAVNTIIGWINSLIGAWNSIEFRVPTVRIPRVTIGGGSFLGIPIPSKSFGGQTFGGQTFSTPNIPRIPELAQGGIVTGPTLARLGEAGPEAVIPLGRGGVGGGLTVQVVLDGATILAADDAEYYITDMVDRAVRRGVKLGFA